MKTSLTFVALFLAASVPGALAAELVGLNLPAGLSSLHAFGAFVITLVVKTALADYSRSNKSLVASPASGAGIQPIGSAIGKAVHALAA